MNVLIDTNVILDDLLNREPRCETARGIMELVNGKRVQGYITANSVADIFYITEKKTNLTYARNAVKKIIFALRIISVEGQDCEKALELPMNDFEDALVVVCAEKADLHYIVTNDNGFLSVEGLLTPTISPADFLLKFEQ
jgi:predicted nucleic acid-binding protein